LLSWRPGESASAKQVQVDVKDGLPRSTVAIKDGTIPTVRDTSFLGDGSGTPDHFADEFLVVGCEVIQSFHVLAWHD